MVTDWHGAQFPLLSVCVILQTFQNDKEGWLFDHFSATRTGADNLTHNFTVLIPFT